MFGAVIVIQGSMYVMVRSFQMTKTSYGQPKQYES